MLKPWQKSNNDAVRLGIRAVTRRRVTAKWAWMIQNAPLRLLLNGTALASNWRWLASRSGAACGAAVKADGYGLGARDVVSWLTAAGCRDFFVATWAEADRLGPLPAGARLAVLHGVRAADMPAALASPARPVLNSAPQVARWREAGGLPCDVMVDTGINRLGLSPEEACSGLLDGLRIDTLMSHLACADEPAHPLNHHQLAAFRAVRCAVPATRYSLANSAGILLGDEYAFDLTRPGIALYGGVPAARATGVQPVVKIEAEILQVRTVSAGDGVGYGAAWRAQQETRIATINLGYADGYLRRFGPGACAHAGGASFPLLGRISMDLITIDVTGSGLAEGDWVELDFDLQDLATRSGLSQYEVLTGLNDRFERRWS